MYRCNDCSRYFNFAQDLRTHKSLAHHGPEERGVFSCHSCGAEFLNETNIRDHVDLVHGVEANSSDEDEEKSEITIYKVKELKEAVVPLRNAFIC